VTEFAFGYLPTAAEDRLLGAQAACSTSQRLYLLSRSSNAIFRHELFLLIPKLHQNVAVPKLLICNALTLRALVGTPRFDPGTSCARG
jgi:hypothetical protein